jgi:hypothetical protein
MPAKRHAMTTSDSQPMNTPSSGPAAVVSEPAWPPAAAVLLLIALNLILRLTLHSNRGHVPGWLIPTLEGALLIVLVVRRPTTTGRRGVPLRRASIALVWLLVAASLWATSVLVFAMVRGGKETQSAGILLAYGAFVWIGNNVAFALLF